MITKRSYTGLILLLVMTIILMPGSGISHAFGLTAENNSSADGGSLRTDFRDLLSISFSGDTARKNADTGRSAIPDSALFKMLPPKDTSLIKDSVTVEDLKVIDTLSAGIRRDSLKRRGDLDFPAIIDAKDSTIEEFSNGKRIIHYYGDVSVKYGNLSLESA
ncbi:MAG: hypothetical protein M0P27_09980, partial [Bacteroidales bacterium]|nr:hypothetical protein [Bacteroidales bacterium]